MTMMVAFGHRKNVGKDTAARFLASHLRINLRNMSIQTKGFSDKGKDILHQLYGWAGVQPSWYYDQEENRPKKEEIIPALGKTYRQLCIDFMSGVGRELYNDTWVDYIQHNTNANVTIIKDLRFPNECERIKQLGGYVYKINRPGITHTPDEADDPLEEYKDWDETIENDQEGNLGHLNTQVIGIATKIMGQLESLTRSQNGQPQG